jgi:hypothetical protein
MANCKPPTAGDTVRLGNVIAHEIAHFLGLGHDLAQPPTLMTATVADHHSAPLALTAAHAARLLLNPVVVAADAGAGVADAGAVPPDADAEPAVAAAEVIADVTPVPDAATGFEADADANGDADADTAAVLPACPTAADCGPSSGCVHWSCAADGTCSLPKVLPCPSGPCQVGTCDDGEPCTSSDFCAAGQCQGGAWTCACKVNADCDDAKACTLGVCKGGACVSTDLDATPCDDGNACIIGDTCANGVCSAGSLLGCDDGNPCTSGLCAPTSGQCVQLPLPPTPCGQDGVCSAGTCTCALGHFAVPTLGSEQLRSVAPTPWGFVAVGDSITAAGLRGLAIAVDLANVTLYVQRLGGKAATSFVAVAADAQGVRVAAMSQLDHADLVRLDALGNVAAQVPVFQGAEAQELLALPDGGAVFLATDLWSQGGAVRLARLSATDKVLWTAAVTPPAPAQVARASAMVPLPSGVWVARQHHTFALPQQTQPWRVQVDLADGKAVATPPLPALPPSAQVLALAADAGQLWLAGETLAAPGGAWLARAPLDELGLPAAATVAVAVPGPAAWHGAAPVGESAVVAGYQTGDGLDFSLRRQTIAGPLWSLAAPAKGKQLWHGVAVLGDGSVVGVGAREFKSGAEAVWGRVAAGGNVGCP